MRAICAHFVSDHVCLASPSQRFIAYPTPSPRGLLEMQFAALLASVEPASGLTGVHGRGFKRAPVWLSSPILAAHG